MDTNDAFEVFNSFRDTVMSIGPLIVKVIPTHRECSVELSNDTSNYTLSNPRMYIKSGNCTNPLPPAIQPTTSATALFAKPAFLARGSVGTFTYDLCDESKNALMKVAVMFKVPFNHKKHPNMYAVGIFDLSKECDCQLYQEMSKSTGSFAAGEAKGSPALTYTSQNVTIMASMSDCDTPVMKVHVTQD